MKGVMILSETASGELEQKILEYLGTVTRVKQRAVHDAIGEDKKLVDKAIGKLASEDKIEYLYLETSYVKLKGKEIPDAGREAE
ncbi:hypothetical protein ES703_14470 [subsurface metagenome]